LTAPPPAEDLLARAIALAGVALALAGIVVNWLQWHRSGPSLKVTAFVRAEAAAIRVEVASTGRLTATVRSVELREELIIPTGSGRTGTQTITRWSIVVVPTDTAPGAAPFPRDVAPSAHIEGDVEFARALEKAQGAPEISVRAWAQLGDGKWFSSKSLRLR
jgi:hypothetical protein